MRSNLRMTILVLLCALLVQNCECVLNQALADGFLGDPLLLKLVADQNEKNVRAIDCWQGAVEIVEQSQSKDGMQIKWRRHVHFAFDRQKQAWLWSNAWLEFSRTQGDDQLPSESLKLDGGMVKDSAYYQFSPYIPSSKQRKTVVIRPIEEYPGGLCVEFTPMEFFAADCGEAAYKRFGGLYSLTKIGGAKSWTVNRVGDMVTVSTTGEIRNHYEVDLSKGANVVKTFHSDMWLSEEITTEYEEKGGIWLPTLRVHKRARHEGTESFHREYKLKTSGVNHAMEESVISIESLGAVAGDRIVDRRDGSERTFGK